MSTGKLLCREPDGMERSSELVMRLTGANATDGMLDLVFSRNEGDFCRLMYISQAFCCLLIDSLQDGTHQKIRLAV